VTDAGISVPEHLANREKATAEKLKQLNAALKAHGLVEGRHPEIAIYATGSLGRHELGSHSDFDVFLIDAAKPEKRLGNLGRIELLVDLIRAARAAGFQKLPIDSEPLAYADFSRQGEYLPFHSLEQLLRLLGSPRDDLTNVFAARMLLLVESEALLGLDAYACCVDEIVSAYARGADRDKFRPVFLMNDLVRYWKTLCLHYEAQRRDSYEAKAADDPGGGRAGEVAELKVEYRVAGLKLRFNRLWTCFNGLTFLLAGVEGGRITRAHARELPALTPVRRAVRVAELVPETKGSMQAALDEYSYFLETTDRPKSEVRGAIADDAEYRELRAMADAFARAMDDGLRVVGERSGLGRFLLL
jgi:hypothetical protein